MNNYVINNSVDADLDAIVTWQYDNSAKICQLIDQFKSWFEDVCGGIWTQKANDFNINNQENVDDYVLSILGKIIGAPRLDVVVNNEVRTMSSELYRRIVVARYRLLSSKLFRSSNPDGSESEYHGDATIVKAREFMQTVFGNNVSVSDTHDMGISFSWTGGEPSSDDGKELKYVFDNAIDDIFAFPAGVHDNNDVGGRMFWLAGSTSDKSRPEDDTRFGGLSDSSFDWKVGREFPE